ncbi:MAG: ribonuclease P protein component [Clostridia bacterium]|nr:ribonuclease P protein component [Clostridia bacterium]
MSAVADFTTVKRNSDFRRAYSRGKSYRDPALITTVIKDRAGESRIGITTGKKIGGAVQRNRARRIIRAAFAEVSGSIKPGYDIIFIARTKTCQMKSTQLVPVMKRHLNAAGLHPWEDAGNE